MFTNKNNILPHFLIAIATVLNILIAAAWVTTSGCASTSNKQETKQVQNVPAPGSLQAPIVSDNLIYFSDMQTKDMQDTDIIYTFEIFVSDKNGKAKEIMRLKPVKR